MPRNAGWARKLFWCSIFALFTAGFASAAPLKQDRSWKLYSNPQWGYCVSYPSRWLKGDAFDGAGIFIQSSAKRSSKPLGAMDVGALSGPESNLARAAPVNLLEDFEVHLDGLKRFERAESVVLLDKKELEIQGSSALFTKDRYYDPQDRATWMEEIIFVHHKGTLYRLELECRADQLERFEPVFNLFVSTFRFDCSAAQP
jgi:hypothetical protein